MPDLLRRKRGKNRFARPHPHGTPRGYWGVCRRWWNPNPL